ncbi:hypothetical protein PN462_21115 [Spirulina sp. CS-785/01]|uniref:hypothetical protein n=1 Tax=Spirulina sp. CS-785/01 TaxID=3021716 RepID=UPI00232EA634|nr:hypothetical protein [Spirulina sp. CS-785/01]MDB9315627.1 hypothetical protein [Spirulina sp. CS-785/01]
MEQRRYRFNRKFGKVYLETPSGLQDLGSEFSMIILAATDPKPAKLFEHLAYQEWVQLCFLDSQGNWGYALLGSGLTNALFSWLQYRRFLEQQQIELSSVITTLSFVQIGGLHQWYDFEFTAQQGKPGLAKRMTRLINNPPFPFTDPTLSL